MAIYDEDNQTDPLEASRQRQAEQDREWAKAAEDGQESGGEQEQEDGAATSDNPAALKKKEEQGEEAPASESSSGGKHASGQTAPFKIKFSGGSAGGKHRKKGFLSKHKIPLLAGGGGVILFLLVILILQLGSLVIPNFTEHMVAWHFSRVARNMMHSTNSVASAKIAIDSQTDPGFIESVRRLNFKAAEKINSWRPQKVATSILDGTKYNYSPVYEVHVPGVGAVQRQKLISIEFPDGKIVAIPQNLTTVGKITNPYQYVRSYMQFRSDTTGLVAKGSWVRNWTVRVKAAKEIRLRIGGQLFRWKKADIEKAKSQTTEEVRREETKRSYQIASDNDRYTKSAEKGALNDVEEKAKEVAAHEIDCMGTPECVDEVIQSGDGVAPEARATLTNSFVETPAAKILGAVSAAYDIAVPLCLIYQASIQNSGDVIDANTDQSMNTWNGIAAVPSAQIYTQLHPEDERVDSKLYGGVVQQLNGGPQGEGSAIANSDAERWASGERPDTSTSTSTNSSAGGVTRFDILQWLGLPAAFSNGVADPFCEVFASVWTGAGVALLEIIGTAGIPGFGEAAKAAGTGVAKFAAAQIAKQIGKLIVKSLSKRELAKMALVAGATTAAAFYAQYLTAQHAGMSYNGAAQGDNMVNQPSVGALNMANQTDRTQNAAAPMMTDKLVEIRDQDETFNNGIVAEQSWKERYLDIHNSTSLFNNVAMAAYYHLNIRSISTFLASLGKLFSPSSLGSMLGALRTHPAKAIEGKAVTINNDYYGIVQWGWTPEEESAYLNDPEYGLLYNEQVVETSGIRQPIGDKYGPCFNQVTTIGTLLADGMIRLDENGNVLDLPDEALCSPSNLGPTGKDSTGNLIFRSAEAQNVFRWRVSVRNNNAIDELLNIQKAVGVTP